MKNTKPLSFWLLIGAFIFFIFGYTIWSYTQTDPNLVLTSWPVYWNWQQQMWHINDQFAAVMYVCLISGLFFTYGYFLKTHIFDTNKKLVLNPGIWAQKSNLIPLAIVVVAILAFSYNALSHDVFNYLFNARMVVKYGSDPHVHTAIEFASDEWVRFMHNIHTPAPYFYGWTGLSLIPYLAGLGKFTLTWLLFRGWSVLGLILLVLAQFKLTENLKLGEQSKKWVWALALHPLILIEIISNSHNDAWMMAGAMGSFVILTQLGTTKNRVHRIAMVLASLVLLLGSMSIKYVTVLLIPIWLYLFQKYWSSSEIQNRLRNILNRIIQKDRFGGLVETYLFDLAAIQLFIPLLTARSQQFHPWYLVWSLAFLPFMKFQRWKNALLILSISSMFRYVPWLWYGGFEFTPQIQLQQKLITWLPLIVYVVYELYHFKIKKPNRN